MNEWDGTVVMEIQEEESIDQVIRSVEAGFVLEEE